MPELDSTTGLVDVVLALSAFEGLLMALYHRVTLRGIAPGDYALNLLSGLCLMLALRTQLAGAQWPWLAAWLRCRIGSLGGPVAPLARRPPRDHAAFLTQALHQALASTCLPANSGQRPLASLGLPW